MTTEKEQLEAEIAKRDARIEALEVDIVYLKSVEKERNALRDELAALKAQKPGATHDPHEAWLTDPENVPFPGGLTPDLSQQPSAGVVLPEPLKRGDEGGSGEYGAAMIRGFNACMREVARLNPCRAQAVPSWADAVEACANLCEERAAYYESGDDDAPGSRRGNACRHCADVIRYNLAAAPSAKKESGDEQI